MKAQLRRTWYTFKATTLTLLLHGALIYLVIFGIQFEPEVVKAGGNPIKATVISQQQLDKKRKRRLKSSNSLSFSKNRKKKSA